MDRITPADSAYARPLGHELTAPQVQALADVAAGKTLPEVAYSAGRSLTSINSRLAYVRRALGADNTVQAVALMDDYRPGWRPRNPFPARPSVIPARVHSLALRPESGPRRAGA